MWRNKRYSQVRSYALIAVLAMSVSACATQTASYRTAFDSEKAISGNSQVFKASEDRVWDATLATLAKQGFTVGEASKDGGVINATRLMSDPNDHALSYEVTCTVTVVDQSSKDTAVSMAANEKTIRHQKYHDWWHLLWLIPIFPTGTEYRTVVRHEGTVTDNTFYSEFFAGVKSELKVSSASAQSGSGSVKRVTVTSSTAKAKSAGSGQLSENPPAGSK
jgi:hypothetical protein